MNNAKYADTPALVQILGCITANVSLLDDEGKYFLTAEDFPKEFHQILFSAISNLHTMGTRQINVQAIEQYLQNKLYLLGQFLQACCPLLLIQLIAVLLSDNKVRYYLY